MSELGGHASPDPLPPAAEGRTLARGVVWIGIFRWSSQGLTWAVTLIVLRILSPQDYGIVGMTTFFVALAGVLSEFGIGGAIVALRDLSHSAIRQLHALAFLLGLGAAALLTLLAWPISISFREPALLAVMPVLSLTFVLDGLRAVPVAVLTRELAYKQASSVDLVRALCSAATVLALALLGTGYWALVGGSVAGSAGASAWSFSQRRIAWEWPRVATLAAPLRFCRHFMVGRLAFSGYQNADFVVAGRMFGSQLLGQYSVGWTIASLPGEKLTNIITAAVTPFFATFQQDIPKLASYYLRLVTFLSLALWPLFFGFMVIADLAIPRILGEQWTAAVPIVRALVFYASLQSISTLNSSVLFLTGNSKTGMNVSILALLVLPPAFYLGGKLGGVTGVAWAWTLMFPFVVAWPLSTVLRTLRVSLWTYLARLQRSVLMVVAMVGSVLLVRRMVGGRVFVQTELALSITTGVVVYGLLCLAFARTDFLLVLDAWRHRDPKAGVT